MRKILLALAILIQIAVLSQDKVLNTYSSFSGNISDGNVQANVLVGIPILGAVEDSLYNLKRNDIVDLTQVERFKC
jgi:hypothetical protein